MKRAKKRFMSMVLTCVMLLGMLPVMQTTADATGWSSVEELKSYALAHWFKPLRGSVTVTDTFGSSRTDGRKHAAVDLWTGSGLTPVYAMTDGEVIKYSYNYYGGTDLLLVKNNDGSVLAYGEISSSLRAGDKVSTGQQIATLKVNSYTNTQCLHLELYFGTYGNEYVFNNGNTGNDYWYIASGNYQRRPDLLDPTFLLQITKEPDGSSADQSTHRYVGYGYPNAYTDVIDLQTMLNKVNGAGLDVDGIFGAGTQQAIKNYQSRKGLTADGICGDATWTALEADYNAANTAASSHPSGISGSGNREYVGWGYTTQGSAVSDLQTMLNKVIGAGLVVDGIFGNSTYYAVQTYQSRKGLTADGICGIDTWTALEADYKAANTTSTPTTIAVSSISIPSTLTLKKGETWPFSATVLPSNATNKKVTWTSSNSLVVTIDTDHLTGVNPGTARVMASAGGKSAICMVTVTELKVAVTRVALSRTSLSLKQGEEQALTLMISPSDATDKTETWSSSNPSVATVKRGIITGVSAGTATITVKVGEKTATCTVTVSADVHKHTLTHTSTKAATEQSTGNIEYWYCSACGKYFSDADATKEISKEQTIVAQLNHTHKLVYSAKKDATCTEGGNTEFWRCSDCSKYFSNAQGKNEISAQSILTAALGHNYVNGVCSRCGEKQTNATKNQFGNIKFEKQTLYFQGQFNDVPANQWFTNGVATAVEFGLMKGSDNGFNPYGDVTLAEAITMAARINSIYSTGSESFDQSVGNAWYQTYLDYAYQKGIISRAYYNSNVTNKATRAQFAEIFAKCLPDAALPEGNSVSDNAIPDVGMSDSFAQYVYKLYRAGILIGGDANGTFSPLTYITRAEAATIVSRMADSNNRVSISLN